VSSSLHLVGPPLAHDRGRVGLSYGSDRSQGVGPAALERSHRARARVEDRIRCAKETGLANLPFRDFECNAVWLELVSVAQELIFYAQTLCLDGELAACEPKTLRYRLLHAAGRLAFHARRAILRLPRSWPWAGELAALPAR
jgi:hypothetical protein